ncbi:TPA: hypothetical protein DDW35_11000 [Candidatus Sumerlaeota bacterium]|jgi:S1-C subfamily serine protease|nr:hypothetical protein [Candidatus Sumerlaeota bacterium]
MFKRIISILALSASLTTFALAADQPQDSAQAGRDVLAKNKEALVFVSAVAKMSMGTETHDEKMEATGLVIDASGLVICSLSTIDPATDLGNSGQADSSIKSSLSDVKIMKADNTEISAKLILKDPDLDLAFIQADKATSATFTAVSLEKTPEAKILDSIITLDRLGKDFGREPVVFLSRISAIVTKPRTFFFSSDQGSSISSPVFLLNGKLLGFRLLKAGPSEDSEPSPVIVPVGDILQAAQQVKK